MTDTAVARWVSRKWLALRVTAVSAAVIQAGLLFQAFSRGVDYIATTSDGNPVLIAVEAAVPLHLAGWGFTLAAILGAVGIIVRALPLAALAHMVISVLYGVFATMALLDVMASADTSGWRTGTAWAVAALLHAVLAHVAEDAWRCHGAR